MSARAAYQPGTIRPFIAGFDGNNTPGAPQHPRTAGTFARVLGRYVREEKALTPQEAIRKMKLMPAQGLERRVPQMRNCTTPLKVTV